MLGILAAIGLITAAGCEVRPILSEITVWHAKQAIIDVATKVVLFAHETPNSHGRLLRTSVAEHRPIHMVDGSRPAKRNGSRRHGAFLRAPLIIPDEPTAHHRTCAPSTISSAASTPSAKDGQRC